MTVNTSHFIFMICGAQALNAVMVRLAPTASLTRSVSISIYTY